MATKKGATRKGATRKGEEMELGRSPGGRRQLKRRGKTRVFTKAKQDRFFASLAATCNVTVSCRAAGIARYTVYVHRRKSAAFRARWAVEVREAYVRLELMMIERMMNGTVKTVVRADGSVERIRDYSDAVALQLLRLHAPTAAEAELEHDPEQLAEARARIADKLERFQARQRRAAAEAAGGGGGGEGEGEGEGSNSPEAGE